MGFAPLNPSYTFAREVNMTHSRRTVVQGIGAGFVAQLAAGEAGAQGEAKAQNEIWSGEYGAAKGDVKLAMYRKRVGAPKAGEPPLPVLFLVHGSSISALPVFDLTVPGKDEYSIMDVFARYGFDVWTMDHENYGRSSRTSSNSDIASGVEDLQAGVEVVVHATGRQKLHFMGESSGAIRIGAYAMARPERVDRLILSAFTYKGEKSPTLAKRAEQLEYFRSHNMRLRDRKMILSIATRDKPGTSDIAVMNALADAELKFGDQCPTGTYLDMVANLPLVDPNKVRCPVMVIRGEYDGNATVDDLWAFYQDLPSGDRQFVILPGLAHSLVLGTNRQLFWHAMRGFLTMPQPVAT
jgi:alpha-beta hydrolase superfamily lysophospholipase